ncbi:unnamed protein product, partial [Symbiodinium microadriaticum]
VPPSMMTTAGDPRAGPQVAQGRGRWTCCRRWGWRRAMRRRSERSRPSLPWSW